jgi:Spy/CpxP family protein refolding chaperone
MRGGLDPQQMAQRQLEEMSQQLKLTATQKAQIKAIQDKNMPRIKAVFDDKSVPADQKWGKIRPLRAATDEAIKKVSK